MSWSAEVSLEVEVLEEVTDLREKAATEHALAGGGSTMRKESALRKL